MARLPEQRHRLGPAEDLLDQFPLALADRVARMPGGPAIDRAPAMGGVLREMGGDAQSPEPGA